MFKRQKRQGTKTTHDEAHVYLVVTNARLGPGSGINVRVLSDQRSVNEARTDAEPYMDPRNGFFAVHKVSVDTIRPWYAKD